jgi:hypothetical protein
MLHTAAYVVASHVSCHVDLCVCSAGQFDATGTLANVVTDAASVFQTTTGSIKVCALPSGFVVPVLTCGVFAAVYVVGRVAH